MTLPDRPALSPSPPAPRLPARRLLPALLAAAVGLSSVPAAAEPAMPAEVEVLPGWRTETGTYMAAIRIRLAPGWKTYWRAPGDAGIPPRFDWTGSRNLASVRFHWPRPNVYEVNGMRSIGYRSELVLPMEVEPAEDGRPVRLRADFEFGVCEDVCVPVEARIEAEIDADPAALGNGSGAADPAIRAALEAAPVSATRAGVGAVACAVDPIADGLRLTARIEMPRLGPDEVAVFELPDRSIWISDSDTRRDGGVLTATSDLVPPSGAPFLLSRSDIRITVLGPDRAVEMWGCPAG